MEPKDPAPARPIVPSYVGHYIAAALWSSNDESDERGGEPFDANYTIDDVSDASIIRAIADCDAFIERAGAMIQERGVDQAMHDLWLTRNGHGAGFWDGDWPEHGDALTELTKEQFGEVFLVLGDDGEIHFY